MADYVIGCMHLGHRNLIESVRTAFGSVEEHDETILKNWNKLVTKDDVVYVLGDVGTRESIANIFPKLRGKKILVKGNHDTYSKEFYNTYFDEVHENPIYYNKRILLSHIPRPTTEGIINLHAHLHLLELKSELHFNIGVDLNGFAPVRIKKFIKMLEKMPKENIKFCQEWYKDIQVLNVDNQKEKEKLAFKSDGTIDAAKTLEKIAERKGKTNGQIII